MKRCYAVARLHFFRFWYELQIIVNGAGRHSCHVHADVVHMYNVHCMQTIISSWKFDKMQKGT